MESADLIMVNTCTVRDKAEQRSMARWAGFTNHEINPNLVLVSAAACPSNKGRPAHCPLSLHGYHHRHSQPHLLNTYLIRVLIERQQVLEVWDERAESWPFLPGGRANLKASSISTGAAITFTYCIVPYVRGREKTELRGYR